MSEDIQTQNTEPEIVQLLQERRTFIDQWRREKIEAFFEHTPILPTKAEN